jgi:hypothetical protein
MFRRVVFPRNRFVAGVAGVATAALLTVSNPVAARTVFPIKGGSGDAGFQDRCPANQYLIGLAGRAGNFVDQVQIVCSPILPDGTHGAPYYGPPHGGTGGAAQEFSCNGNAFVSGVEFYYYKAHPKVFDVQLSCRTMQGQGTTVNFGSPQGVSFENENMGETQQCASDELASGLAGRYGTNVNAIGLLCDASVTGNVPAPAPSSWPIRLTGKVPAPVPPSAGLSCPQGFVWREASPTDHVCVTPEQRTETRLENAAGPSRVSHTDHTYGPQTCVQGYVWRAAFTGDAVCVTPLQRDAANQQNNVAPAQIRATSP